MYWKLLVAVVVLAEPLIACAKPRVRETSGPSVSARTTLRAEGVPAVLWMKSSKGVCVQSLSIVVGNHGAIEARGIRVHAILPGGSTILLRGASRLVKRQKAIYTASGKPVALREGLVRIEASCQNCRR